jgi:ABC-2 type transport system ATP-binding protein
VAVRYGKSEVLADLSLELSAGQVYALLGSNGAGKSSLVRCILGMQRPAAGRIRVLGLRPWRDRAALLQRVAFVPERPDAPRDLTARQLGQLCRRLYATWDPASFDAYLELRNLPPNKAFGQLSRGQQTQLHLGLALAARPKLIVLDDPTLGLDAAARRWVFDGLIQDLHDHGTTVFLTTHDLAGVETLADRIGILHGGRLLVDEDLEALKSRFRLLRFPDLRSPQEIPQLAELAPLSVRTSPWGLEVVLAHLPGSPAAAGTAQESSLNLEEIFLAMTGTGQGGSP